MFHRELRYCEVGLTAEQQMLADLVGGFLGEQGAVEATKTASMGFDEGLWQRFGQLGLVPMSMPLALGGDGGGLTDVCVVAEQCGRFLAPLPFIETVVGARLAAAAGADEVVREVVEGSLICSLAPETDVNGRALVPAGAIAGSVIALLGDDLVLARTQAPVAHVSNLGDAPLAWWSFHSDSDELVVLATGAEAQQLLHAARREWKLCSAALLLGLATGALKLSVDYAKSREAFGVPIGYFQSVAHPLVDVAIAIDGLTALVGKAAWFEEHEPHHRRELIDMALVHAAETANAAATAAVHTLGGVGFTVESDAHLYFRRAKTWSLMAGTATSGLQEIAGALFDNREATAVR